MNLQRTAYIWGNTPICWFGRCGHAIKTYFGGLDYLWITACVKARGSVLFNPLVLLLLCVTILTWSGCVSTAPRVSLAYFPPPPATARVVHLISFNSLRDLVARKPSFVEKVRGGVISPFVDTPAGIAYRSGVLYVCDTGKRVVHRWDLQTGSALRSLSSLNGVQSSLGNPVAVSIGDNGMAYVADVSGGAVLSFDIDGRFVRRYKTTDRDRYKPVAVAQSGDQLFVADIGSHMVDVFSINSGERVNHFGGLGSAAGKFYYPMGIAISQTGQLIVSDMMNSRVQVFSKQLEPLFEIGQPGNRYGDMGKPRQIAVGPDGVMFIADTEFQRVQMFDAIGQLLMLLGRDDGQPGRLAMPIGVAVAKTLPDSIASLVPTGFDAAYYLFVTNAIGQKRINLFAVGKSRTSKQSQTQ